MPGFAGDFPSTGGGIPSEFDQPANTIRLGSRLNMGEDDQPAGDPGDMDAPF
jgi:hypothetical protein